MFVSIFASTLAKTTKSTVFSDLFSDDNLCEPNLPVYAHLPNHNVVGVPLPDPLLRAGISFEETLNCNIKESDQNEVSSNVGHHFIQYSVWEYFIESNSKSTTCGIIHCNVLDMCLIDGVIGDDGKVYPSGYNPYLNYVRHIYAVDLGANNYGILCVSNSPSVKSEVNDTRFSLCWNDGTSADTGCTSVYPKKSDVKQNHYLFQLPKYSHSTGETCGNDIRYYSPAFEFTPYIVIYPQPLTQNTFTVSVEGSSCVKSIDYIVGISGVKKKFTFNVISCTSSDSSNPVNSLTSNYLDKALQIVNYKSVLSVKIDSGTHFTNGPYVLVLKDATGKSYSTTFVKVT